MLNQSRADLGIPDESRLLELGISGNGVAAIRIWGRILLRSHGPRYTERVKIEDLVLKTIPTPGNLRFNASQSHLQCAEVPRGSTGGFARWDQGIADYS